ncbi:MAG: SDR family NAD(P)-dependent oxidoreductase [Anaerolineae bacterium]
MMCLANTLARSYLWLDAWLDTLIAPSYTNLGYHVRRALMWDATDLDVDLGGKVIAITGANSGIGFAAARALAQRGATVYVLARSFERGEEARRQLIVTTRNPHIYFEQIDLSSLASVRACADRLLAQTNRLDGLINNAGAEFRTRTLTVDGLEASFATNILGPFLLTKRLLPLLKRGAPSRIINVSSGGMYTAKLDVNDLQFERKPFNNLAAYAQAKRAQVMMTELWAALLYKDGVSVNAMHPGWADTPIVRAGLPTFRKAIGRFLRTPAEGADTIVWLMAAQRVASITGEFWFDRCERAKHKTSQTHSPLADYRCLWDVCEELTQ